MTSTTASECATRVPSPPFAAFLHGADCVIFSAFRSLTECIGCARSILMGNQARAALTVNGFCELIGTIIGAPLH